MSALLEQARRSWPDWFGQEPTCLRMLVMNESSAHPGRLLAFVFADRQRRPSAVVKWAMAANEAPFVRHEHDALRRVARAVPPDLGLTMPAALGLGRTPGGVTSWTSVVEGQRVPDPLQRRPMWRAARALRRFAREALSWSRALARSTADTGSSLALGEMIERFGATYSTSRRERSALSSYAGVIDANVQTPPCWQHGDVSFRNTLRAADGLRMVDWEHAVADAVPWYDHAVLLRNVVLLASKRRDVASVRASMAALLPSGHSAGAALREESARVWDHDWPLAWGITTAWMDQALRRRDQARSGDELLAALPLALIGDPIVREAVPWLVPAW